MLGLLDRSFRSSLRPAAVGILIALLAACQPVPGPVPITPQQTASPRPPQTAAPAAARSPTMSPPTITALPEVPTVSPATMRAAASPAGAPSSLTICLTGEPENLNPAMRHSSEEITVLEALYGVAVRVRDYEYQAGTVAKVPRLADGDAQRTAVSVSAGDLVFDSASGAVVRLPVDASIILEQAAGGAALVEPLADAAQAAQLVVTWTLTEGLRWEDDVPVTADDFVFAWEVARELPAVELGERDLTAVLDAVDARTLRWKGVPGYIPASYPLPPVPYALPRHLFVGATPDRVLADEGLRRSPPAYGPFRVSEWIAGDHLTLERNPAYWRSAEGLPRVDQLLFRFVPDASERIAQVASGTCDVAAQDPAYADALPHLRELAAAGKLKVQTATAPEFEHLDFNASPVDSYTGFAAAVRNDDGTPIFANIEIRRAFAYCLDRQALAAVAAGGEGVVPHAYVPPDHPLYAGDGQVMTYGFDPEAGRALLARNGWIDHDGDGVLDKGGQPFRFVYSLRSTPVRERVAALVHEQLLTDCGLDAQVALRGSEFLADGPSGLVLGRQYDVAEFAWSVGAEPPCGLYVTDALPGPEAGWGRPNVSGYADAAFDAACGHARAAIDPAEARAWHAEAQRLWTLALPEIPLYAPALILVHRVGIEGLTVDPTAPLTWDVAGVVKSVP